MIPPKEQDEQARKLSLGSEGIISKTDRNLGGTVKCSESVIGLRNWNTDHLASFFGEEIFEEFPSQRDSDEKKKKRNEKQDQALAVSAFLES